MKFGSDIKHCHHTGSTLFTTHYHSGYILIRDLSNCLMQVTVRTNPRGLCHVNAFSTGSQKIPPPEVF